MTKISSCRPRDRWPCHRAFLYVRKAYSNLSRDQIVLYPAQLSPSFLPLTAGAQLQYPPTRSMNLWSALFNMCGDLMCGSYRGIEGIIRVACMIKILLSLLQSLFDAFTDQLLPLLLPPLGRFGLVILCLVLDAEDVGI